MLKISCVIIFISFFYPTDLSAQKDSVLTGQTTITKITKSQQTVEILLIIDGASFGVVNVKDIQTPQNSKNTFLSGIDVKDIATLNILKGAETVKKYGEKAKDGVLIITTKDGKYINENWRIRD